MENEPIKDVILQLAAMSGEVSEVAVMYLPSSEKYLTNLLLEMRHDNLIKRCDKDNCVGYRLSQAGKKYLTQTYPERYRDYFGSGGITSKVRLDDVHRQRYQRMSEVNAMMYNIGATVFPGIKSPLAVGSQSSQPMYYTSFEIKGFGDEAIKIAGSRAMGLLRCGNNAYLMYHTDTEPIKWEEMTEYRTRILLGQKVGKPLRSIMLGTAMDGALTLLRSNGGKLNRYYKVTPETQTDMLYVPRTRDGEFLLRFAVLSDAFVQMKNKLLSGIPRENGSCSLVCDGYADAKTGVLFACDFDMVRLMQFSTGLEVRKMNGIVFCFDFQAEILRQYFGDTVTIRAIDSAQTAALFRLGGKKR